MLRFLTAGSVDDGKSTLIGRLLYDTKADPRRPARRRRARRPRKRGTALDLSLLTDGLTAEREQGITIDVAYRYFATARRKFIIADAPGHEQYTRNMVTAASTAQLAVLLVDARHGIVTQTRRHATLAHLLGIPHLVVAVNKMDLVGFRRGRCTRASWPTSARSRGARASTTQASASCRCPRSAATWSSSVDGETGLRWYTGPTLLEILETAPVGVGTARAWIPLPGAIRRAARRATPAAATWAASKSGSIAVGDARHRAAVRTDDDGARPSQRSMDRATRRTRTTP